MTDKDLIELAKNARKQAYCPYSHVAVGAALLCADGKVYVGANIENAAFSPSLCAERVAFAKAVNAGERDFLAVAVVGARSNSDTDMPFPPCGVCLQVMQEFCSPGFRVILEDGDGCRSLTLREMLPHGFDKSKF